MTDSLVRIVGPVALGNSATTVYAVPAATTVTVRNIHVSNESAALHTFRLSVGTDGAGKRMFYDVPVLVGDPGFDWTGTIVLATGEVLQAYADAAASLTLVISAVVSV